MCLSILQHKEINIKHVTHAPLTEGTIEVYEKVYTLPSLCLFGKGIKVLVSYPDLTPHETIKVLAHNHLIHTTSTHWLH